MTNVGFALSAWVKRFLPLTFSSKKHKIAALYREFAFADFLTSLGVAGLSFR
jgi:hypothetical protein